MNRTIRLTLLLALLLSGATQAQLADGGADRRTALKMGLYPPDMIMRNQQRLGITDAQRAQMTDAVKAFQTGVADLQWALQREQQALRQVLAQTEVDGDAALQQVDKVLALENQFKRAHFSLLITVKNALTEEQVAMINEELRRRRGAWLEK